MKHRATPRFWACYDRLPEEIQQLADRCYQLLLQDPRHPSLHFKRVGQFWSVRVGLYYRALAIEEDSVPVWVWIGTHAEYDQLLRS
jgi:hypothetical protein